MLYKSKVNVLVNVAIMNMKQQYQATSSTFVFINHSNHVSNHILAALAIRKRRRRKIKKEKKHGIRIGNIQCTRTH